MVRWLIFCSCLFICNGLSAQNKPHFIEIDEIANWEKKAFQIGQRSAINSVDRSYFDVQSQELDIEVTPPKRFISGIVTTEIKMVEAGNNQIILDLSDSLRVDTIWVNQKPISFEHKSDQITLVNTGFEQLNSEHNIRIKYHGVPVLTRAFSADTTKHGAPVIWTLSEPYGAKDWWPCKQDLKDKIERLTIKVTVPDSFKVAANGLLTETRPIDHTKVRYKWEHNYPIVSYLVAFSVAQYSVHTSTLELKKGPLQFVNYIYPEDTLEALTDLRKFDQTMNLFEELFGAYPFRKEQYGHAQFGWGGGMEHQTMSFMVNFKHGLVAHELAHQWFGDQVTCGSWSDLWLNESFATYAEGLTYDFLFDDNTWDQWKENTTRFVTAEPGGSVFVQDTANVDRLFSSRLTYRKGAYLLHMLRFKMGDEAFFRAIRSYLESKAYGFARTDDLIWHLKANGGEGIDEFFEDWFYRQGHPIYQLKWFQQSDDKLHMVLHQKQSHIWEGVFYDMDVPLRIIGDQMDSTILVKNRLSEEEWLLDWPDKVRLIVIDPERWILAEKEVEQLDYEPVVASYKIAPNPVQDELNIFTSTPLLPEAKIEVYDAFGKLTRSLDYEIGLSTKALTINVTHLKQGVYTLTIQDYWSTHVLKFIKL